MFFVEGPKVLFKVALAAIQLTFGDPKLQKDITGFFELTRKLRDLPIECTHESILVPEVRYDQTISNCLLPSVDSSSIARAHIFVNISYKNNISYT